MSGQIDPGLGGIAISGLLMLAMVVLARLDGQDLTRKGAWAAARATGQLFAAGLALNQIFLLDNAFAVLGIMSVMLGVAAFTASRQVDAGVARSIRMMALVLGTVTATLLFVTLRFVLDLTDVQARYAIPLGGMLLGNAMTSATLCANRYIEYLQEQRATIETSLSLGASPGQADMRARQAAFKTAVTPVLNAMMVVGVVKLPGIMSGQILGGSSPLVSAKYQLVVLFVLAAGDGLSALWTLRWLRRRAFSEAWQLRL